MPRRSSSVSFRVIQAVVLAALATFLVAIYFRQERLSALHVLSLRRSTHERAHAATTSVAIPRPTQAPTKALPEPWASHHMFAHPGHNDPCPSKWVEGTWTSKRSKGSATLPLSLEAQREIYALQHPTDCSKAKYLLYKIVPNGLGAVFHVTGVALQLALDLGRVFVESEGTFLTNSPECEGKPTLDSCYFLPFAGCRPTAAQMKRVARMGTAGWEGADVVLAAHEDLVRVRGSAPQRFLNRLQATPIQPEKYYYWWRAQSVTYLLRPNAATLAELERRRKRVLAGPGPGPGCISVHVRHGDKGVEAETFDDPVYDRTATKVLALAPSALTNQLFVSTEDPGTINYFVNATADRWRTGYTAGVPRKPNRLRSNLSYMAEIGYSEELYNALLNLDLALECSAFVGSIYSNWVRLIDELRATMRCKADAIFADVVYDNPHEMDLNW